MKKLNLVLIYTLCYTSSLWGSFSDPKNLSNVLLKQSINQILKKKCPNMQFQVFTLDDNNMSFNLYQVSSETEPEMVSKVIVEINRDNKWLILFSSTPEKHRRKHYNIFLRAALFKYYYHNKEAKRYQVVSEVSNPASAAALQKYFKLDKIHTPYYKDATPIFYLNLKENQKKVQAHLKAFPDC